MIEISKSDAIDLLGHEPIGSTRDAFSWSGERIPSYLQAPASRFVGHGSRKVWYLECTSDLNEFILHRANRFRRLKLKELSSTLGNDLFLPIGRAQIDTSSEMTLYSRSLESLYRDPAPFEQELNFDFESTLPNYLQALEDEAVEIFRSAISAARNPAMLFSMGKDSMVMLALAIRAFYPAPIPFPLVVIDTRWKFKEMYNFRTWLAGQENLNLEIFVSPDAEQQNVGPYSHGSALHTQITKTEALKAVLAEKKYDFVFGGGRRDEEKSRAKERVFSLRNEMQSWNPKTQRPELWGIYNLELPIGHSMRVFPISNFTESDIWKYIKVRKVPVVPLYFSQFRPVAHDNGQRILVNDSRAPYQDSEISIRAVRFRTLGCYPLTGASLSQAVGLDDVLGELEITVDAERTTRVIDNDGGASMEQKKRQGYF